MANTNLRFFRGLAPETPAAGDVLFSTEESVIKVYSGSNWESFGGKVLDVTYDANSNKLTLTRPDGTTEDIELKKYTAGDGIAISDENVISALDETLDADLPVIGVTVGNYKDGQTITKGTSIQDILKTMLTKELDYKVKSTPKVALKGVSAATKVVGETVEGTLEYTFTDGSFTKYDNSSVVAGCTASNPVYTGSLPLTVALGQNKFKVTVDYSASTADLKTNLGNPSAVKIDAGSVSSSEVIVNGTYPSFATTKSASELTQQALKVWNSTAGSMETGNMVMVPSTKTAPRKFSVPRKATSMTQLNTLSNKMETVALSAYTESTETRTYGGTDVTYYTYTFAGDAEGSVTINVKF